MAVGKQFLPEINNLLYHNNRSLLEWHDTGFCAYQI